MERLDLRKELKHLYAPPASEVVLVDVPAMQFVMTDGKVEPGEAPGTSPGFQGAMQALYGAAFTIKFMSKLRRENPVDYPVMPLEGLWWAEGGDFDITSPGNWRYTLMIMLPSLITQDMFQQALAQLREKRPGVDLGGLRMEWFHEGLAVQTMHVGPYNREPSTIQRLHDFAQRQGLRLRGRHHEIYLGDPRRASPDRLKTVLRQPVEK